MGKKTDEQTPMEDYIKKIINDVLDEREEKVTEQDAKEIIKAIIPEIESLVSKVVLNHARAIATYTLERLKEE